MAVRTHILQNSPAVGHFDVLTPNFNFEAVKVHCTDMKKHFFFFQVRKLCSWSNDRIKKTIRSGKLHVSLHLNVMNIEYCVVNNLYFSLSLYFTLF